MKIALAGLFGILLGLIAGNFLFQLVNDQNWAKACERSFFELIALIAVYVLADKK